MNMKTGQAKVSSELDARINEAEVCRSMGLYDESLEIYKQVLGGIPESDTQVLESIKSKIAEVKKELTDQEQKDSTRVSAKDISMLKKTLSSQQSGRDILSGQTLIDSAASFKELGLFGEAVNEYEKLLTQGHPPDRLVSDCMDCLLKLHSPDKVVTYATKLTGDNKLSDKVGSKIQYHFGRELEKRDHKDIASDLYKVSQ